MILFLTPKLYLGWSHLHIHQCTPRLCGRSRCPTPRPGCCSLSAGGGLPPAARTCQEKELHSAPHPSGMTAFPTNNPVIFRTGNLSAHLSNHCATCKWKQLPVESISLWTATKKQMVLFCLRYLQCHIATVVIKTVEKLLLDCSVYGELKISDFLTQIKLKAQIIFQLQQLHLLSV